MWSFRSIAWGTQSGRRNSHLEMCLEISQTNIVSIHWLPSNKFISVHRTTRLISPVPFSSFWNRDKCNWDISEPQHDHIPLAPSTGMKTWKWGGGVKLLQSRGDLKLRPEALSVPLVATLPFICPVRALQVDRAPSWIAKGIPMLMMRGWVL